MATCGRDRFLHGPNLMLRTGCAAAESCWLNVPLKTLRLRFVLWRLPSNDIMVTLQQYYCYYSVTGILQSFLVLTIQIVIDRRSRFCAQLIDRRSIVTIQKRNIKISRLKIWCKKKNKKVALDFISPLRPAPTYAPGGT